MSHGTLQRDHPRVCGEHFDWSLRKAAGSGSSPRMRGTLSNIRLRVQPPRDHPRVCGEHLPTASVFHPLTGSSPRMRGTPWWSTDHMARLGIIPAYAGNTQYPTGISRNKGDHPRVCGEHPYRIIPIPEDMGSSPRMRGTLVVPVVYHVPRGIIPAYAGNTDHGRSTASNPWDHPRVCGEHVFDSRQKTVS